MRKRIKENHKAPLWCVLRFYLRGKKYFIKRHSFGGCVLGHPFKCRKCRGCRFNASEQHLEF